MATIGEVKSLLERFQDVKFSLQRRDVDQLIKSPQEFENVLLSCLITWDEKTKTLYEHTMLLTANDIAPQRVSPKLDAIIADLTELIEILRLLKSIIGPVTFEDVVEDITKNVQRTIEAYTTLLEVIAEKFPYDANFAGKILSNLRLQATLGKWGNKITQTAIHQAASKPLPGKKEFTYTKRNKLSDALLDFGNHIWILSRVLYLFLFFSFIQTKLAQTIQSTGSWAEIVLWIMLGVWAIRSIRRKKLSIFLSGLIIWGIPLMWIYGYLPLDFLELESMKSSIKIVLWFTVIFWFPIQFLNVIRDHRAAQVIILLMIWSGVLALFSYGTGKGLLVATLLLFIPISRLFRGSKAEQQNLVGVLDKRLYIPTAISLIIVALFVTREGLWLIGAIIWIMFSVTAGHSFRYFRKTYDLIEELYPNPAGKRRRHLLLFITLMLSTILLFPGLLGKLQGDFVLSLYTQASGLAFGLITILLAVQAIIPGITTWSADTRKANRLREMRSILRANAGLEGFMQWFFILFIFSLLAWFLSSRFLSEYDVLVDLSRTAAFDQPIDVIGEIYRITLLGQVSSQASLLRISTLIFGIFIYATIYGIAQLYYLFVAANTLTLPIRDSIFSNPVEIESVRIMNIQNEDEIEQKRKSHQTKLQSDLNLNGHIINQVSVIYSVGDSQIIESIDVEFELDFVELNELLGLIKSLFSSLFMLGNVGAVNLSIARRTFQNFRRQPVFGLEIYAKEWDFVKSEIDGFPLDYKLRCLGARLSNYTMAESQIA